MNTIKNDFGIRDAGCRVRDVRFVLLNRIFKKIWSAKFNIQDSKFNIQCSFPIFHLPSSIFPLPSSIIHLPSSIVYQSSLIKKAPEKPMLLNILSKTSYEFFKASAPETISKISLVMAACLALL